MMLFTCFNLSFGISSKCDIQQILTSHWIFETKLLRFFWKIVVPDFYENSCKFPKDSFSRQIVTLIRTKKINQRIFAQKLSIFKSLIFYVKSQCLFWFYSFYSETHEFLRFLKSISKLRGFNYPVKMWLYYVVFGQMVW